MNQLEDRLQELDDALAAVLRMAQERCAPPAVVKAIAKASGNIADAICFMPETEREP